jgi:hypothetical protein
LAQDIQFLKSTLIRQLLDNTYRINRGRMFVGDRALSADGKTMDALQDPMADHIPCDDVTQILPQQTMSIVADIMPVIQYVTDSAQTRTGIAPNLSLDPQVLQQSTLGAFTGALEQASQRVELIARTFAETGVKWMVMKAHRLLKEHSQKPVMMKIKGEWVEVNPSDWRDRQNVSVNVGLGFNDRTKDLMLAQTILGIQKEALGLGLATPENIYNALSDMVMAAGKKTPERYFTKQTQPPQPQPDPNMIIAQAQAEAMKVDAQSKMERAKIEGQKALFESQKAHFEGVMKAREADVKRQREEFNAMIEAAKARADIDNVQADTFLKKAQAQKALHDAHAQGLENEAVQTGVMALLEGRDSGQAPTTAQ